MVTSPPIDPLAPRLTPTVSILKTVLSVWWLYVGAFALIVSLVFCFQTPAEQGFWADNRTHFVGPLLLLFLGCVVGAAIRIVRTRESDWQKIVSASEFLRLEALAKVDAANKELGAHAERQRNETEEKGRVTEEKRVEREEARTSTLARRLSECGSLLNRCAAEGRRRSANPLVTETDLAVWLTKSLDEVGALLTHVAQRRWAQACHVDWNHLAPYSSYPQAFGNVAREMESFRDSLTPEDVTPGT